MCVLVRAPLILSELQRDRRALGRIKFLPVTDDAIVCGLDVGMRSKLIFLSRVDKDRSGVISDSELQQALSNGKSRAFLFLPPFTCDVRLISFCFLLFHLLSSVLLCCQHSLLFNLLDLFLSPFSTLALL